MGCRAAGDGMRDDRAACRGATGAGPRAQAAREDAGAADADRRRVLVWQGAPRSADGERRDLRHARDDGRASDAAARHARGRDQSEEPALGRGPDQRPRPRRAWPHHRSVLRGRAADRLAERRHVPREPARAVRAVAAIGRGADVAGRARDAGERARYLAVAASSGSTASGPIDWMPAPAPLTAIASISTSSSGRASPEIRQPVLAGRALAKIAGPCP